MFKAYLAALLDISFSDLITPRIIRELYVALAGFLALLTIVFVAGAFGQSLGAGLISLFFAPLVFVLGVTAVRIWVETVIVLFRVAEHMRPAAGSSTPGVPHA